MPKTFLVKTIIVKQIQIKKINFFLKIISKQHNFFNIKGYAKNNLALWRVLDIYKREAITPQNLASLAFAGNPDTRRQ